MLNPAKLTALSAVIAACGGTAQDLTGIPENPGPPAFVNLANGKFAVRSATGALVNEVDPVAAPGTTGKPSCSSDAARIAYSHIANVPSLYVVNLDGSNLRQITATGVSLGPAAWSADGNRLAVTFFDAEWTNGSFTAFTGLATINADGSAFTPFAGINANIPHTPSWSPDGTEILYIEARTDEVKAVNVATGATRSLGVQAWQARWSPDGTAIAVMSEPPGPFTITTMSRDGANQRVVATTESAPEFTWTPDGRILYGAGGVLRFVSPDGRTVALTLAGFQYSPHWCGTP